MIIVTMDAPYQTSHCWVYPVAPSPRNGQNMAILWPKHDPQMVLKIKSCLILIPVPRDVPAEFHGAGCIL